MIVGLVRLVALGVDTALFVPVVLVTSLLDRDAKLGYRIARYWALVKRDVRVTIHPPLGWPVGAPA